MCRVARRAAAARRRQAMPPIIIAMPLLLLTLPHSIGAQSRSEILPKRPKLDNAIAVELRQIDREGIVSGTPNGYDGLQPLPPPPQPWWARCQPNASNGTTCRPCMNSGDCPHPKLCPAAAHATCCHPKATGPWLRGHCRCLPAVPIAPHSPPGFCPDPHPPPQPQPQPGPPSHPGQPVTHDIIVKFPSKLPVSLPVLDRKDVIDLPYSNRNLLTWGYKPWIARVPTTGELLMTYSAMGKTLLVIRRSNTSGASWGAPEVHPELSASPGARNNRTDQEWSIHVLHDATVLLNDGSCSMFRSKDLGRTFRAVQGDGGDPFHFNSTDECGSWSVLELTEPDKGMPAGSFYFLDDSIWRSTNSGAYWRLFQTVHNRGELSTPMQNFPYAPWSPFAKFKPMGANGGFFFQSEVYRRTDGRFIHGARTPVEPGCDDYDGSQLWRSVDTRGKEWVCASPAAGGFCDDSNHTCLALQKGYVDLCNHSHTNRGLFLPGSVYSHFLRLHDGRLLLTWTHRTPKYDQDGYGGGTRALVSYDDGDTFDAAHDYIVLSAQNDSLNAFCVTGCGCRNGYGNTIQLPNGTLVSVYCHDGPAEAIPAHRNAVVSVVRWALPKPLKTDESGMRLAPSSAMQHDDTSSASRLWFSFYDLFLNPAAYGNCSLAGI